MDWFSKYKDFALKLFHSWEDATIIAQMFFGLSLFGIAAWVLIGFILLLIHAPYILVLVALFIGLLCLVGWIVSSIVQRIKNDRKP